MDSGGSLDPADTLLVVVDVQEKFRKAIRGFDDLIVNARKLAEGAKILNIPVIATEQYPQGLGKTVDELSGALDSASLVEKTAFSCSGCGEFNELVSEFDRKNIVLCGIESHVCVLKTALDLKANGYNVHVVADAVSSRKKSDYEIALTRLKQSGVYLVSTEMVLFQLIDSKDDENFKTISSLVK
jgi:nicotinamidase-related amidase